jgi:hypothetical protein
MGVVAEVRETGDSGEGEPDDIELPAGDVILVVTIRSIQGTMGIACQERLSGCSPAAVDSPVVAA